jgi:hypothetical protein
MIAFSILVDAQTGQTTSLRFICASHAFDFENQLSNSWPFVQIRL